MKKLLDLGKADGITSNLPEPPQRNKYIPRIVITLGWVSFFTDMASEMNYPLIPLFLVQNLGAPPLGNHPNPAIDNHFKTGHSETA